MAYLIQPTDDTFALLPTLATDGVDIIITDPPYSEHVHANLCSGSLIGTKSVPKYQLDYQPLIDYQWLLECIRIARRWVVVFCDVEAFGLIKQLTPCYVRGCVWHKSNAMGQLTADRPATAYEGIALLHTDSTKKRWNGKGSYGIWSCAGTRGKPGRHPNEKPIDLCRKLVSLFSDRGETVFDPFCGSGAIGQACLELGRNYIGMDKDREWCLKAEQRLMSTSEPWIDEAALALCSMRGQDVG
jgi:DNA modification methylase